MFCTECEHEVKVTQKAENEKLTIHGVELEFEQFNYYCNECGEYVFDEELEVLNSDKAKEAYCKKTGIISNTQIKNNILEKYDIGASALGTLLGWGESTIQRYLDGDIRLLRHGLRLMRGARGNREERYGNQYFGRGKP